MNNKILKTIAILCLPIMTQAQTLHVTNGANLFVITGAILQFNGSVKNVTDRYYQPLAKR